MGLLYFEDFPVGESVEYGRVDVTAEAIVEFARQFDPQTFHLDEEAGREVAGGLIGSGWQTTAFLLGMNCEAFLTRAAGSAIAASKRSIGSARCGRAIVYAFAAKREWPSSSTTLAKAKLSSCSRCSMAGTKS